jgi:hypothetical protein
MAAPRRERQSAQADFVWLLRRIYSLGSEPAPDEFTVDTHGPLSIRPIRICPRSR